MVKSVTKHYKKLLLGVLLLQLALLATTRFTAWPEMLTWPYLLTKGWLPYKDIIIAHTPLLVTFLSFFYKIVGVGVVQMQMFTWTFILSTTVIVWVITKKLWSEKTALLTVLIFSLLLFFFQGNGLWFDLVLVPLLLMTYFFLRKKKYIIAGIIFALALYTKQTALWLMIPITIQLFVSGSKMLGELEKRFVPFMYGMVIVIFLGILLMYFIGILPHFTRWAIEFGTFTLPHLQGQVELPEFKEILVVLFPLTPLGILTLKHRSSENLLLASWALFSSLGVFPRWELFHIQPALPFVAIGTAILFLSKNKKGRDIHRVIMVGWSLIFVVLFIKSTIPLMGKESRFYGNNEQKIVKTVQALTHSGDEIYVVNYWDNVYALSDTLPAVDPLIPYIPWYLSYNNFDKYISLEVRTGLPEVIVRGDYGTGLNSYKINSLEEIIQRFYSLYESSNGVGVYLKN